MVKGKIQVEGKISISKIAENTVIVKDKNCIYRSLGKSPWDDKTAKQKSYKLS